MPRAVARRLLQNTSMCPMHEVVAQNFRETQFQGILNNYPHFSYIDGDATLTINHLIACPCLQLHMYYHKISYLPLEPSKFLLVSLRPLDPTTLGFLGSSTSFIIALSTFGVIIYVFLKISLLLIASRALHLLSHN
jgi:uncharacterized membrane protein